MRSALSHLVGSESGVEYDAGQLYRLDPVDDRPLLAIYDLEQAGRTLTREAMTGRRGNGLWRWRELLPVQREGQIVHLGEGDTPLLESHRLGDALGLSRLMVKAEGGNPTGSFKARGMAAAVSRNREIGATGFIVPSAGNAAGALAAYAAAADVPATVLMPTDAPTVNQVEAVVCGARLVLVDGLIDDCSRFSAAIAARTGLFDVSTLKEPYRVEGKKTMGLELAEQLDWELPDVVVYPTGGGTGLIGMWKAFDELEKLGLVTSARPRMVSVQAAGCAPIVRAFEKGARRAARWESAVTRAAGLRVPAAVGDTLILDAVRASSGTAVAVDEADIDRAQLLAGRHGGGYTSPETAAALAATGELGANGWIGRDERVVVFDTGTGLKYPAPELPTAELVIDPATDDPDDVAARLADTGL